MNEMIIPGFESDKKRGEDCSDLNSDTCFAQLCEDRREIKTYNFDAAVILCFLLSWAWECCAFDQIALKLPVCTDGSFDPDFKPGESIVRISS